ncbi:MAG: dihydropteroate synthase [Verrucomicrobiota bacterium]|nr:dihydropteroate synthase [Verrucomicrobiota bacterium]
MTFHFKNGTWPLLSEPRIFGILNVTPDSFFDGGQCSNLSDILENAEKMIMDGADAIDIGGASSRPGAPTVSLEEELIRVIPAVKAIRKEFNIVISVDTFKPEVADSALDCGAQIINDITAGRDGRMAEVVKKHGAGWILMHMQGTPQDMQESPFYHNVAREVLDFLIDKVDCARKTGIHPQCLAIDPGIGFGKNFEHNMALLSSTAQFAETGLPVMIGTSRKSFLGKIIDNASPEYRLPGSLASILWAYQSGAQFLRVHDVQETVDALKTWMKIADFPED